MMSTRRFLLRHAVPALHRQAARPLSACATLRLTHSLNSSPLVRKQDSIAVTRIAAPPRRHFSFDNESHYHTIADATLEDLQDAVEEALEDAGIAEFEITLASGVLTMVLPPHGTWVLNKQTPNQQLWWSSPLSGPRRYEHDFERSQWVFTRGDVNTLRDDLAAEMQTIYGVQIFSE